MSNRHGQNQDRNKSGTRGGARNEAGSQVTSAEVLASLFSLDAERGGFEPPVPVKVRRFSRPANDSRNDKLYQELRDESSGEVPVLVPSPSSAVFSPDLARVLAGWDGLPEAIQTAILAIVEVGGAGA